jgi:hypothetical protein
MSDHPKSLVETGHVEPAPRRVRGFSGGRAAFETTRALTPIAGLFSQQD